MAEIKDAETKKSLRTQQGDAYRRAAEYLRDNHVDVYAQEQSGDILVTVAAEEAEGMYQWQGNALVWQAPDKNHNQHIEVMFQDADDLRFLPGFKPEVLVMNEDKQEIEHLTPQFIWHPYLFHYGQNFSIPEKGTYYFTVRADPPDFGRHDEILGKRYEKGVQLTFGPFELVPEREPHGPE